MQRFEEGYCMDGAIEYWTKAAALGDIVAHLNLSHMYRKGLCVEKDEKKELHHLEQAAIGGNPSARYNLGCYEGERFKHERAVKHWIIAANLGDDDSMKKLKKGFKVGLVSKEDFAAALRAHHAAVDATKSPQRVAAEKSKYYRGFQLRIRVFHRGSFSRTREGNKIEFFHQRQITPIKAQ
jgi:TPR repeat protein